MPTAAPRPCRKPGCPQTTTKGFCEKHRGTDTRQHDQHRGNSAARGYGSRWRKLRLMVLAREPLCRRCGQPATDVDHIVPKRHGGSDSMDNLQALCHAHHSMKTGRGA